MKAPSKPPAKKPIDKQNNAGFNVGHAMDLASTSVDAMKSYADYKKEVEITTRAKIDGQKEVILGEHSLEKSRMEHSARLIELDNTDKDGHRHHEQVMTSLAHQEHTLEVRENLQDRVLRQLEAKEITAEEAALLLYGDQE